MRRSFVLRTLILSAVLAASATPAHAHLRDYIFSQGYHTTRKGEFEVELHNDYSFTDLDNNDRDSSRHQIELEYGLTNRLQLAYYDVFTWDRRNDWERDAFKLEGKYRLFEAGELPVDITLYGEYINPDGSRDRRSDEMELKLILAKDLGPWNVTGNLITKRKINDHDPWGFEYTLSAGVRVHKQVKLALELKEGLGTTEDLGIHRKGHKLQLMPLVAFSPTPKTRILFGPAIGLTHAAEDLQLKTIVEIEF